VCIRCSSTGLQKVLKIVPTFQVLEERLNGNTCPSKHRDTLRVACNRSRFTVDFNSMTITTLGTVARNVVEQIIGDRTDGSPLPDPKAHVAIAVQAALTSAGGPEHARDRELLRQHGGVCGLRGHREPPE